MPLKQFDDIDIACETLNSEAQGILRLVESLRRQINPQDLRMAFQNCVNHMISCKGRIVLAGIGKSGHVAHKIQSTFASTGTPSIFVHPAEASHGDMGMIQKNDMVLIISNSGETAELADIVAYTRRFNITLIAMTTIIDSTLAKAADIVLCLPQSSEACPMGLAPTTSCIMQMALGDSLALALLKRRGFTPSDFSIFHPGGKLGVQLQRVKDLMHTGKRLPLSRPDTTMQEAVIEMTLKSFGCLGVIDDKGILIGLITDGDLRRVLQHDLRTLSIGDVMNNHPTTVHSDLLAAEALRVMNDRERPISSLFVLDSQDRPIGIIHVHDLVRAGIS